MRAATSTFAQLCTGADAGSVNLALNRPCQASNLWSAETECTNAIDGDRDHSYPNLFHTGECSADSLCVAFSKGLKEPAAQMAR